jgi:hypothetical protein
MSRHNEMTDRLDKTLTVLEDIFLEADDKEILEMSPEWKTLAADVRSLIAQQVDMNKQSLERDTNTKSKQNAGGSVKDASRTPIDVAGRLNLLRSLIATRSDLSPRLSSVFSAGRKPSEDEVNELMEELIRLGMIKDRNRKY